jgi:penicillin-binding protein 1A
MEHVTPPSTTSTLPPNKTSSSKKFFATTFKIIGGFILSCLFISGIAFALAYPNLPPLDAITSYQPKMPLRIFSADGALIGEFGEERRNVVPLNEIPDIMKKAVLAIEDDRFYQHSGVDYMGIARAATHNLIGGSRQGASTITQQVARNFFLSNEQTFKRKIYEVLLAWKIEKNLSKDRILELYMNQIYLGQRAYGFASAAQIYFGKKIQNITLAEAAMLAGLPKAPSANNPVANPKRARARQQYILTRMYELGYITQLQLTQAQTEPLHIKTSSNQFDVNAEYVAEMVRQLVYEQFKEDTYTKGFNVYTTIVKNDQAAAYAALRRGVMNYERRYTYRGPEGFLNIPENKTEAETAIENKLAEYPDSPNLFSAIVLNATPNKVRVITSSGEEIDITDSGLVFAKPWLGDRANPVQRLKRGAIIRITQEENKKWSISQIPQVEAAFISMNSQDGGIRALVGGFDYNRNKFNHVTQAWRQPGSSFKPFIYSASLEKGLSPGTMINDAPISFDSTQTGSQAWEPKNYDNKYEGLMTMRKGLTKSKNMVSIRILNKIGAAYGQEFSTHFGFDSDKNPPYLTLALGAGAVTPMQMATAYSVFANGGFKTNPYLIAKITNANGKVLFEAKPSTNNDETKRVISDRNVFLIDSMLKDVVKYGTATKALSLNRPDIAGKTGTTNDSVDAWFAGYHPQVVGVAWMGFDQPKNLGNKETGGGLALPIWVEYMQKVLPALPVVQRGIPEGITEFAGEFYYSENSPKTNSNSNNTEEKNELF